MRILKYFVIGLNLNYLTIKDMETMAKITKAVGSFLRENWPGILTGAIIALDIIYFGVWP